MYHLGLYIRDTFPDVFDIVPLGGTMADPQPLKGTIIGTRFVVRIKGDWTPRQIEARDKLIQTLLSDDSREYSKNAECCAPTASCQRLIRSDCKK